MTIPYLRFEFVMPNPINLLFNKKGFPGGEAFFKR
jgi:hypothetical protein